MIALVRQRARPRSYGGSRWQHVSQAGAVASDRRLPSCQARRLYRVHQIELASAVGPLLAHRGGAARARSVGSAHFKAAMGGDDVQLAARSEAVDRAPGHLEHVPDDLSPFGHRDVVAAASSVSGEDGNGEGGFAMVALTPCPSQVSAWPERGPSRNAANGNCTLYVHVSLARPWALFGRRACKSSASMKATHCHECMVHSCTFG